MTFLFCFWLLLIFSWSGVWGIRWSISALYSFLCVFLVCCRHAGLFQFVQTGSDFRTTSISVLMQVCQRYRYKKGIKTDGERKSGFQLVAEQISTVWQLFWCSVNVSVNERTKKKHLFVLNVTFGYRSNHILGWTWRWQRKQFTCCEQLFHFLCALHCGKAWQHSLRLKVLFNAYCFVFF